LHIAPEILDVLKVWKQATQFSQNEDWIFASPVQIGRLPWSYDQVWRKYDAAAVNAGLGGLGTHALRHTYRSWLDAVGTPIAVQQKLMRHADSRTTMNVHGDVVTDEMQKASGRVAMLALNGRQTAGEVFGNKKRLHPRRARREHGDKGELPKLGSTCVEPHRVATRRNSVDVLLRRLKYFQQLQIAAGVGRGRGTLTQRRMQPCHQDLAC
jgi:Phage integrase family